MNPGTKGVSLPRPGESGQPPLSPGRNKEDDKVELNATAQVQATTNVLLSRRARIISRLRRGGLLYAMLALPILWYLIFAYLPMLGLTIAFQDYSLFKGIFGSPWVGLQHFQRLFGDPYFWQVAGNTLILGSLTTLITFPLPIILAVLLNEMRDGVFKRVAQSLSYLPYFVSIVALVNIVILMLSPSTGVVNHLIAALGFEKINFIVEAGWFRPVYIFVVAWASTGWTSIIYLAAMSGIDPALYQAAEVDGAGRLGRIRHVTLPGIIPTISLILILSLPGMIGANVELVLLLQRPITYETSDVIGSYIFRRGIMNNEYDFAAAVAIIYSLMSIVIIYIANRIARRFGETSLW